MIGKTLGNFQCTELLGKGGMGEVYKAKDQKLGRDVAIKVLPEEFAKDADRVARFQREAKLLASLNHPNIAAIYGLEESEDTHFLVLELIEGDTLADRLKRGAIPVEESLKLALQIAEALEAAHEKGVIHRDLKPANIKVTPDGKVKVLDFGLAKAYAGDPEKMNLSNSPTLSDMATQQGVILGTAGYMSPEQARGKPVDKRADIWAFGVVLHEMLTGKSAFSGRDVTDTLAAVIRSEPDWKSLPVNLHWRLKEVLERCLEKEAKDRYHDIVDARLDIQKVLADPSGVFVEQVMGESQTRSRSIIPWVVAVLGVVIIGAAIWYLKAPEPGQVSRFNYDLPKGQNFSPLEYQVLAISPDGKRLVYSTNEGLYQRSVDEWDARLIPGTEGVTSQPFFSPDSKWIGYFVPGSPQLKKIPIDGGTPVTICDAMSYGVHWTPNDTIIFGQSYGNIMQVSANGGTPESLIESKNPFIAYPQMLPDGKTLMFTEGHKIVVQSLESGDRKELLDGYCGRYLSTGYIVYGMELDHTLYAVSFDLDKLKVTGDPVPIVENAESPIHWAFSDSGTLVYIPQRVRSGQPNTLVWVDRKGKEEQVSVPPGTYETPKISPDGSKIALTLATEDTYDIYIWDIEDENRTRLTLDGNSAYPIWAPDGEQIFFQKRDPQIAFTGKIFRRAADGMGEEEVIDLSSDRWLLPWSSSRDGNNLALLEAVTTNAYDIGLLSIEGEYERKSLIATSNQEISPDISPDGKWLAYVSLDLRRYMIHIYVRSIPDVRSNPRQVPTDDRVVNPLWSPNGKELFYIKPNLDDNEVAVVAVEVETEPTFNFGPPKILFQGAYDASHNRPWDIHPDGDKFLMLKPTPLLNEAFVYEAPYSINIVQNWFEELKERIPVD